MSQKVLTIAGLNEYIGKMLDADPFLTGIAVRGEISNYKVYPSGHHYFSLKDENATLKCVMFRGNAALLKFRPENGMKVIASGRISVYPRDGVYQLYCSAITMDGVGDLYAAYEQLKKKLASQGLFDPAHKKTLPSFPKTIGIITSPAGAAVHDMLRILKKRYPLVKVIILPVRVQGAEAPAEIASAILYANKYDVADLLIVGRGGGSLEDLWAFNDERLARVIYDCEIPIISAVGHETDFTIADYAADLRAPTPSAAAELAVCEIQAVLGKLIDLHSDLYHGMMFRMEADRQKLQQMNLKLRMNSPRNRLEQKRNNLVRAEEMLPRLMQNKITEYRHRLQLYINSMKGLSPLNKLQSGFSYVADKDGKNISTVDAVSVGDMVNIAVTDGYIDAQVKNIKKENRRRG